MKLLQCLLVKNDCYKAGVKMKPKGVMVHSTGANNPNVKRYVQPAVGQEGRAELLKLLGKNTYNNDWNRSGTGKCVHAFIGMLADGTVGTVQTLPWDMRGWHCGKAANNTHISFEICEDGLKDPEYFDDVYRGAVELTAYLCKQYGLDPLADGVVICHKEGARRGIASDHVDVEHWFPKFGKTMDDFRRDVAEEMKGDEDMLTGEEIVKRINEYTATLTLPGWAKKEFQEAVDMGITDGTNPMGLIPRHQAAIMALRAAKQAINASR